MKESDSFPLGLIMLKSRRKRKAWSALLRRCAAFCVAMILAAGSCLPSYAAEQETVELSQPEYSEPEEEGVEPEEEISGSEEEEPSAPEIQGSPADGGQDEEDEQDDEIVEIIRNPRNVRARLGETVVLTVEAEGDALRYRWQWTLDGEGWEDCTENGYDCPELRMVMTKDLDGRHYRCLVSSGDYTIESSEADIILSDAVEWTLETGENGTTLRFFGKGEMDIYDPEALPWEEQADTITSLVVEDGVTSISAHLCSGLCRLERDGRKSM